ncbi:MAG: hypothetical protein HN597_14920 [Desulfobacula sp.]|jgi:hypothetical protein|uniref:hypothetical protein n=1 Tax=Desulfobacula sp. TaxID=2593537 RepID=UPI0039B8DA92|nr:hypothetical protein [Desulfobacula sp.]
MKIDGYKPVLEEYPSELKTCTLTSIIDFLDADIDSWRESGYLHVSHPNVVSLISNIYGDFNQRVNKISAIAITTDFRFGSNYDIESFIIAVNSQFKPSENRDYLLSLVSSLTAESSQNITDNGVSQKVIAKAGITMKQEVEIKNPIKLQPYRTFTEIEQPESEFVFRISNNRGFECSLHPCDGAAWKLEAIQSIKAFFKKELKNIPIIA